MKETLAFLGLAAVSLAAGLGADRVQQWLENRSWERRHRHVRPFRRGER
jgi:hypothetical protein